MKLHLLLAALVLSFMLRAPLPGVETEFRSQLSGWLSLNDGSPSTPRGGKLLKTTTVESVRRFAARWVPDRARFKDAMKETQGTEFVIHEIEFDAVIPDAVFSKAALKK